MTNDNHPSHAQGVYIELKGVINASIAIRNMQIPFIQPNAL